MSPDQVSKAAYTSHIVNVLYNTISLMTSTWMFTIISDIRIIVKISTYYELQAGECTQNHTNCEQKSSHFHKQSRVFLTDQRHLLVI